jgi:hypothetical protein
MPDLKIKFHALHPSPRQKRQRLAQLPDFYSGATDQLGRFIEGFLLRRLHCGFCGVCVVARALKQFRNSRAVQIVSAIFDDAGEMLESKMKKAVLFAFALIISVAGLAQPSFAAASTEPSTTATEPMKAKPAKHKSHKHERHTSNTKAHKAHRA